MKKLVKQELDKILKNYKSIEDIDWNYISIYLKLSENFIREFKDKVDWKWISIRQEFSYSFICEFREKLNLDILLERKIITQEDIIKMYQPVSRFELMEI